MFALVYTGKSDFSMYFTTPPGFENIWLGDPMGKIVYLTDFWRPERMRELPDSISSHIPRLHPTS